MLPTSIVGIKIFMNMLGTLKEPKVRLNLFDETLKFGKNASIGGSSYVSYNLTVSDLQPITS